MKTFLKGRQTESLFEPIYFANAENKIFHQYGRKFPRGEEKKIQYNSGNYGLPASPKGSACNSHR